MSAADNARVEDSRPATILVVEDDPAVRGLLGKVLRGAGYDVLEAPDGRQGMSVYRRTRPDLVLLDIVMPEKDGLETLQEIRKLDASAVIFTMSGGTWSVDNNQVATLLGAERSFLKPIDLGELLEAIRAVLR